MLTQRPFDDLVRRLPDAYAKNPESNNYKLLLVERDSVSECFDTIKKIDNYNDIMQASGKTLDLYGEIAKCARGSLTDEQYRIMILAYINRNFSDGSYQKVKSLLVSLFGCREKDFSIVEFGNAHIAIENLPLGVLLNAGITQKQLHLLLKQLLPICIEIDQFVLSGTFEFSSRDDELDNESGFGNVEQTVGGYLGAMSTDNF